LLLPTVGNHTVWPQHRFKWHVVRTGYYANQLKQTIWRTGSTITSKNCL